MTAPKQVGLILTDLQAIIELLHANLPSAREHDPSLVTWASLDLAHEHVERAMRKLAETPYTLTEMLEEAHGRG